MHSTQTKWLAALDLSSQSGSLSLFHCNDDVEQCTEPEHEIVLSGTMKHSEELFGALDGLIASRGLKPRDVSEWWVSGGPGSFTGLRIALAAVKGVATATRARIVLCDGFETRVLSWLKQAASTPPELIVSTRSTSTQYVLRSYRWETNNLLCGETVFATKLPTSNEERTVLSDIPAPGTTHWPSQSRYLVLARNVEVVDSEKAMYAAAPKYFASREHRTLSARK